MMKTDEELKNIIAERIRISREEKGLSQTELGELFDKKKTTISTWERGSSMPDITTLYKLANFFNKSLAYFYGDSEQ